MWGTDQAASLAEDGIKTFSEVVSKAPTFLGNGKKFFRDEEKKF